ncbi:HNH endonuclease [Lysinibacillus mangiferihumi]|nr:HNH endonuclease signature motif containing protein [Lysinibacillus mangiferihumi]
MNKFIVMQNATHGEEINGGYMWSPQKDKRGSSNHAYLRMTTIKAGDKIYSCYDKAIRAIGIAKSDCYIAAQPHELQEKNLWSDAGYKVDVDYTILEQPIIIAEIWGEMELSRPQKYSAFQVGGKGNQAYLFPCPDEWDRLFDSHHAELVMEKEMSKKELEKDIHELMIDIEKEANYLSLEELAIKASQASEKGNRRVTISSYNRNPYVGLYVKKRANGVCELCDQPAQFNDKNGYPYLECHHIEFLSEGGPDIIENCVALCVVCHKKAHILNEPADKYKMLKKVELRGPLQEVW